MTKHCQTYEEMMLMVDECWVPDDDKPSGLYCENCGDEIIEGDADTYTNEQGDVFCCLHCALDHAGLSNFDWYNYFNNIVGDLD